MDVKKEVDKDFFSKTLNKIMTKEDAEIPKKKFLEDRLGNL